MPRRSKVYRGLEYLPVDTCADSAALRFEKARVLGGASMGTRPRRIEEPAAMEPFKPSAPVCAMSPADFKGPSQRGGVELASVGNETASQPSVKRAARSQSSSSLNRVGLQPAAPAHVGVVVRRLKGGTESE